MKKKGFLFLVMMLLAFTLRTQAATYSSYLPGGKNYLNPENFRLRNETIESIESFKVLPNQTYTLTFPGDDMFPNSYLTIGSSVGQDYADGVTNSLQQCTTDRNRSICTFTTLSNETSIYIRISSSGTTQFFNYYKLGEIQLEEGSSSTSFEAYIAPQIDIEEPSFSESGAFIMSYLDQTPIGSIISNHITVYDEIDGDLSNQIVIESDEYTNNMDVVGSYVVRLSATDSSGNKATFDLTIIVKDEISPIIDGPSTLDVSVNDGTSLATLIANNYTINDDYDGPLSYVITNDNYSINKDKIGSYNVTFTATDSSLNSISKSVTISVFDDERPTISGPSYIESPMSNPITIGDILDTQSVSDNYSSLTIADVSIIDQFSSNEYMIGFYDVILSVEDSSGNKTTKSISIEVVDDVAPIISGPVTYLDSYTSDVALSDIIELLSISDNNELLSTNDIVIKNDTLTNRTSDVGVFIVEFEITDASGNVGNHTIEITLVDDMPPVIYVDSYIINVGTETSFSNDDALRLLLSSNELAPGEYQVNTVYDEYQGNEKKAGSYVYRVSFTSDSGDVTEKEFIIKVIEDKTFFEEYLSIRNVILYGASMLLIGLTIYKAKK